MRRPSSRARARRMSRAAVWASSPAPSARRASSTPHTVERRSASTSARPSRSSSSPSSKAGDRSASERRDGGLRRSLEPHRARLRRGPRHRHRSRRRSQRRRALPYRRLPPRVRHAHRRDRRRAADASAGLHAPEIRRGRDVANHALGPRLPRTGIRAPGRRLLLLLPLARRAPHRRMAHGFRRRIARCAARRRSASSAT